MITPAEITIFVLDGEAFTNIRIAEVGAFRVPSDVIRAEPLYQRVLDVINIRVDASDDAFILEARGSTLTTELLSPSTRLEIVPKFGFNSLGVILAWSSQSVTVVRDHAPVNLEEQEGGLVEMFARLFIDSLQPVSSLGWVPRIGRRMITTSDVYGDVDGVSSSVHQLTTGRIEFVQEVNELDWRAPANRVVKSALVYLHGLRRLLSAEIRSTLEEYLSASEHIESFARGPREALASCEEILTAQTLDPARSYFYGACRTARPILQALARTLGGSPRMKDTPFRVEMPSTIESALRNYSASAVGSRFSVRKEGETNLYDRSQPKSFNPLLEPDIVVRPVRDMRSCDAVLDVKYKERPSASDHYQLAAYARRYGAQWASFVTITDEASVEGLQAEARLGDGVPTFEYAVPALGFAEGLSRYGGWLREQLRTEDPQTTP